MADNSYVTGNPGLIEDLRNLVPQIYTDLKTGLEYKLQDIRYVPSVYGSNPTYTVHYRCTDPNGDPQTKSNSYTEAGINQLKEKKIREYVGYDLGQEIHRIKDPYSNNTVVTYRNTEGKETTLYFDSFGKISNVSSDDNNIKNKVEAAINTVNRGTNTYAKADTAQDIINIPDCKTAAIMLDKLARVTDKRRVTPLSMFDYISYPHRKYYEESRYNLQIGDTWFIIPPEFIVVTSEAQTGKIITLRQENTQKTKSGYHRRTILIDLVVHGNDQINGFEVDGPEGKYYIDGLRPLLAQFKRTPFLPIFNELINDTYGIHVVALQSITIRTVENFPDVMTAQITLQEMNMMPYIEMHSINFQYMIDWDLIRFYYQKALTETHEYKKLQSIPTNKEHNHFIMRSLNSDILDWHKSKFETNNTNKFIDVITDKNNYDTWIDSSEHSFSILEFSCSYSNMLANIQMSEAESPTVQFMGGMDTIYNIVIETTDLRIIENFEQGRINNDLLTRKNPRIRSLGFVMLESELVEFTGSLFVMIDTVTTNTVPGFPGLYHIQITCVAYDIGQSEREQLNGFLPFEGDAEKQTISQSEEGVYKKITQDLYAEHKIINTMEVYPDLHLPTYDEVDEFIVKCNKFRKQHGLSTLPYTKYPRQPYSMLHGCQDYISPPSSAFHPSDITTPSVTYNGYVDPDFYVFYNMPYANFIDTLDGDPPELSQRTGRSRTKFIYNNQPFYTASGKIAVGDEQTAIDASGNVSINNKFELIDDPDGVVPKCKLTKDQYELICKIVNWVINPNNPNPDRDTILTVAQCFYDKIMDGKDTISSIIQELGYKDSEYDKLDNDNTFSKTRKDNINAYVYSVFSLGNKSRPEYSIYGIYDNKCDNTEDYVDDIDSRWSSEPGITKITDGTYSGHGTTLVIYADKNKPSTKSMAFIKEGDTPEETEQNIEDAENSSYRNKKEMEIYFNSINQKNITYKVHTLEEKDIKYFAEPLIARTSRMIWREGNDDNQEFVRETLNDPVNVYNSCFTNMYQYSARGRLVRAFPAFLLCVLDDQAQWFDGKKLWTNYYVYHSVIDIQVHATNDMPTETAVITITNSAHNLSQTQPGLSSYNIRNDKEVFKDGWLGDRAKDIYNLTGLVIGGIKLTEQLIELHQILYDHARLREGARIHLRMGYGSDPFSLAPMINGHISDITLGDQITMVVTSDGHEMIQALASASEKGKDVNNGFIGLFGLGATQESSNIIAKMMVERSSWLNHLFKDWFEASKYGIEHFGIYFHNRGFFSGTSPGRDKKGKVFLDDIWNEAKMHWDILKNVYISNYLKELYVCGNFWDWDKEKNFSFNKYNMTPWDVTQLCTQQVPEYICKCIKHQFDSRLFFGLPSYMERYRYDFFGGSPYIVTVRKDNPATTTTIGGDKDSLTGEFTNDTYNSGPVEIKGGGKNVEQVRFSVQFEKKHTLSLQDTRNNPDTITIYGIDASGNETSIAYREGNFDGDHVWSVAVSGSTNSPNGVDLSKFVSFRFKAYSCHDRLHKGKSCCENAQLIKGEIIYKKGTNVTDESTEEETELYYGDVLFEECKTSAQAHYLDSMTNIIDNQVRVTNKFSNTNVKCMYIRGSKPVATAVLYSDDTIDPAYQKTTIVDTPIVQDTLGPDALWEFFGYQIGQESAERVGISTLLYGWQQQYQGEIILFGSPGINPHDYLMVDDVFSNLHGLCICREVIHSFNSSSGYTTSVTPGMIGFDTKENSGLITHTQNLLATLNAFSIIMESRLMNIHFIEQYVTIFSQQLTIINDACKLIKDTIAIDKGTNKFELGAHYTMLFTIGAQMLYECKEMTKITAYATNIFDAIKGAFEGVKAAQTLVGRAVGVVNGIKNFYIEGVKAALGVSGPVGWAITIGMFLLDKLINTIVDWWSNKNVVVLLPMYWQDYPFVSGVKDGEKILLMDSNATATEENDKSEGKENPNANVENKQ